MLAAVATLTCCSKEETHFVKVDTVSCSFDATGAEPIVIGIQSSPSSWKAESTVDWVKIDDETASSITLIAADNTDVTQRSGKVVITAGQATATIMVSQIGKSSSVQSNYYTVGHYVKGAVVSPNGKYVGGFTSTLDESGKVWIKFITIRDIRNDVIYNLDPFPGTLYSIIDPCAITDSGDIFFQCEDGRIVRFALDGDITVLDNIPGAGRPWLWQVGSDESGVWVGHTSGNLLYNPVKWTNGVPEILPMPEKSYRDRKWSQGVIARGCSLDGQIIYGTAWDGLDSGLVWWDKNNNVQWVGGDDIRKINVVQRFDEVEQKYYDFNLVEGILGTSSTSSMSPSGKWIAGGYQKEKLAENEMDIFAETWPAFFDTETGKTYILYDYPEAFGITATDSGIGVIGLNASSGITEETLMVDIVSGAQLSTTTEWIEENLGIMIPNDSLVEFISPDGQVVFGYDLRGEGGEMMRKFYVAPKPKK